VRSCLRVGVLVILASSGLVAQDGWFELYDSAIKDIESADYGAAERKLRQARKLNPRSGRSVLRLRKLARRLLPDFFSATSWYLPVVHKTRWHSSPRHGRRKSTPTMLNFDRSATWRIERRSWWPIPRRLPLRQAPNQKSPARETSRCQKSTRVALPPVNPTPERPPPPAPNYRGDVSNLLNTARAQISRNDLDGAQRDASNALNLASRETILDLRGEAQAVLNDIESRRRLWTAVEQALAGTHTALARKSLDALAAGHPDYPAAALRARLTAVERTLRTDALYRQALSAYFAGRPADTLEALVRVDGEMPLDARGYLYRAASVAALAASTPDPQAADCKRRLPRTSRRRPVGASSRAICDTYHPRSSDSSESRHQRLARAVR
jgi:hypothetical protein